MEQYYSNHPESPRKSGSWTFPAPPKWWLDLPETSTQLTFTVKRRVFGPMASHQGVILGLAGRLFYDWFYTDDFYFARVDYELKGKGL